MKRKSREYLITHAAWVFRETPQWYYLEENATGLVKKTKGYKNGAVYIEPERQDEERRVPDRFGEWAPCGYGVMFPVGTPFLQWDTVLHGLYAGDETEPLPQGISGLHAGGYGTFGFDGPLEARLCGTGKGNSRNTRPGGNNQGVFGYGEWGGREFWMGWPEPALLVIGIKTNRVRHLFLSDHPAGDDSNGECNSYNEPECLGNDQEVIRNGVQYICETDEVVSGFRAVHFVGILYTKPW